MSTPRTLAVILAADAVGYSRLAEKDEKAALAAVAWFKDRAAEIVGSHGGRIFARAGDGIMMELPSASAGVRTALELAETVRARVANADRPTLPIRIGAHLGDVTPEGDDRMGHDVNVAARLEQIAEAGEILVSRALAEAARGKVDARFERVGMERLKNLSEAVEVFRVLSADAARSPKALPVIAAAAAAAVIVALGAGYTIARVTKATSENEAAAVASSDPQGAATSIAVLPFADMSPEGDQEYFSDGLSEELLNQLARISDLRVIARTSSFAFKGQNADVRTIGQALGVANLLEGSVRKSGDRLRITAQLVRVSDGSHIWSQTYDRRLDDVFAIQDEISRAVAERLSIALGVGESVRLPGGTQNVEAYELALRARDAMISLGEEERGPVAAMLYRQALALDPEYAQAWTELSGPLRVAASYNSQRAEELLAEADRAIDRALALEPDLVGAYYARGGVGEFQGDWRKAAEAYERVRELTGEAGGCNPAAMDSLGFKEGPVICARLARDSDPLSLFASQLLQRALTRSGGFAEADAEYERSRALPGDREQIEHMALLRAWETPGSPEIEPLLRRYLASNTVTMPVFHAVADVFDDPEAALPLLRAAASDPAYRGGPRLALIALWLGHYGDAEAAVSTLHAWSDGEWAGGADLLWFPSLDEARRLPAFKDVVRDFGLVDYWRATGNWGDFCRPVGADDFACE